MKKEANKKNRRLLWISLGIVVLMAAVVASVFLLPSLAGLGKPTTPTGSVDGRPDLYWNVDKDFYTENSESGLSTRVTAEDGLYHIRFAYNGEQVEYTASDKQLVNYIDTLDVMGLVLEDETQIVDVVDPKEIAKEVAKDFYVHSVKDNVLVLNSSLVMNGMKVEIAITDLTECYDVSAEAETEGQIIALSDFRTMDTVTVYANDLGENTHVYLKNHAVESKIYWREAAFYDSDRRTTTRVPDENGVYNISVFCEGELVTLKTKDKAIATSIDSKNKYRCVFGCIFDEEGYVTKLYDSALSIQGIMVADRYDITQIDGDTFTAENLIQSTGETYAGTISDDCVIYDVSMAALSEGRRGKAVEGLQLGDRISAWTDTSGKIVLIYVSNRMVDGPSYFNVTRKYDSTIGETTRVPNSQGYYEVELLVEGVVKTFKTKDKALISRLDSYAYSIFGLKVNGNIIEYVYDPVCLFGFDVYIRYVTAASGAVFTLTTSNGLSSANALLAPDCKIYNASKYGQFGEETTLQVGDYVYAYYNASKQLAGVYVIRRHIKDAQVYWNLERKYDSVNKVTTREPDENGWYVFEVALKGEQTTVKTKSKAIATKIDSYSPQAMGLIVSGGVVQDVCPANYATGGTTQSSGYYVTEVLSGGTVKTYYKTNGKTNDLTLASDCKIYNVSTAYYNHKGEETTLQVGDRIVAYTDSSRQAKIVFVRNRDVDDMYCKTEVKYSATTGETTREPDAEGWYVYTVTVNGELKTVKTKDKKIASQMDYYGCGFGMVLRGDVVGSVVSYASVKNVDAYGVKDWTVISIDGKKATVKYCKPGSEDTGKTQVITLASNVKIYDVSPTAEQFGAVTTLQVGDQIRSYADADGMNRYVYVRYRDTRVKGQEAYCEHCDQFVSWIPWNGGSFAALDGHYYLLGDRQISSNRTIGSDAATYEIVLDLNGKSISTVGRRLLTVYKGSTLTVLDSVGGGTIAATGTTGNIGGVVLVVSGGTLNLHGGTIKQLESEEKVSYGGAVYISGEDATFNMYGGTVTDGTVYATETETSARGGNVYVYGGTFNMYGGTVSNGSSTNSGGNVYVSGTGIFNMSGGIISGGKAERGANVYNNGSSLLCGEITNGVADNYGGNIYGNGGSVTVSGAKITDGHAGQFGGNVYMAGNALNITDGHITGGTAENYGGNVFVNSSGDCEITISGGTIDGDVRFNSAKSLIMFGAPKIGVGAEGGLKLANNTLITLGALTEGAEICLDSVGVFTNAIENAENYVSFFKYSGDNGLIYVENNALAVGVGVVQSYCAHCDSTVSWFDWSSAKLSSFSSSSDALLISGHYYLSDDITVQKQVNIGSADDHTADVVLDLQGHTWSNTARRAFLVYGTISVMDTAVNGTICAVGNGNGGVVMVSGGTLNLYNGTMMKVAGSNTEGKGGVVYLASEATFNMYDGALQSGAAEQGGNLYSNNSTVNIFDGSITGGNAQTGSNVYIVSGTAAISGGIIDGEVQLDDDANLTVTGSAVINRGTGAGLVIPAGTQITLGELNEDAKIFVSADGVFTNANENAQKYLDAGYVESVSDQFVLKVVDNSMVAEPVVVPDLPPVEVDPNEIDNSSISAKFTEGTTMAVCPKCGGEPAQWTVLNDITASGSNLEAGHYYLADNYSNYLSISGEKEICIHLNGYNWIQSVKSRALFLSGTANCVVNIMGEGTVCGSDGYTGRTARGATIEVNGTGVTLNLLGGIYTKNTHNSSDQEISGPTIALYTGGGEINVYENVMVEESNGQEISVNKGSLHIYGGTVNGELVVSKDGEIALSGSPVIKNLELAAGVLAELCELTEGADITVTAEGKFTKENENAVSYLSAGYIKSTSSDITIIVLKNCLIAMDDMLVNGIDNSSISDKFAEGTTMAVCPKCGGEPVVWTALNDVTTGGSNLEAGHYYLTGDYGTYLSISGEKQVCIHLNGYTWNQTVKSRALYLSGTANCVVNIMGEGTVSGSDGYTGRTARGATVEVNGSGVTLNLFGGIYTKNTHNSSNQEISGPTIALYTGGGEINVYKDVVVNESNGSEIAVTKGNLSFYGGTVNGEVIIGADGSVALSGTPVINNLDLTSGIIANVGMLTDGAQIAVSANSNVAFTEANDAAADYVGYFKSADPNKDVSVDNGTLILVEILAARRKNSIFAFLCVNMF